METSSKISLKIKQHLIKITIVHKFKLTLPLLSLKYKTMKSYREKIKTID